MAELAVDRRLGVLFRRQWLNQVAHYKSNYVPQVGCD